MSKLKLWPADATALSEKAGYLVVVVCPLVVYTYLQLSALGLIKNLYQQGVSSAAPFWHITGALVSVLAVRQILLLMLNKSKIKSKAAQIVIALTLAIIGLLAYGGFNWRFEGGDVFWPVMPSAAFLFLGTVCKAIADTLYHQFHASVFKWRDPRYWNPNVSWRYVNYIPFTRFRPDAWHLANGGMIVCFLLLAIVHKPCLYWLWELLIGCVYVNGVFNLFYKKLLRREDGNTAQ